MKELFIAFTILCILATYANVCSCSNLGQLAPVENDPELFQVCQRVCQQHYSDTYGVQEHRKINKDVVCCMCVRHRGNIKLCVNVDQYEQAEDTQVDVEVLKP